MERMDDNLAHVIDFVEGGGLRYQITDGMVDLGFTSATTDYMIRIVPTGRITTIAQFIPYSIPPRSLRTALWLANEINRRFLRWGCFMVDTRRRRFFF